MTRLQRTQKFNNLFEEEFFLRLYNLVKKNTINKKLIYQYKNFYNNLIHVDMFLDLNSNFVYGINWNKIREHKDLNIGFILKYSQYIFSGNLNTLMNNRNFKLEWLEEFPNAKWDYFILSEHKNFTIDWVEKFPYKDWDFNYLSRRKDFKLEWLDEFPKNWRTKYYRERIYGLILGCPPFGGSYRSSQSSLSSLIGRTKYFYRKLSCYYRKFYCNGINYLLGRNYKVFKKVKLEDFYISQEEKKFVLKRNPLINNKDFIKISDKRWKKYRKTMFFY